MCGIAGFIDYNNTSSEQILQNFTNVLSHRGPDGSGYDFFQDTNCQVGLGHRRLSIIDLSSEASQPMLYKNLSIIFNGEIYNYIEIKLELEKEGHQFLTHSDTEVILHAWEHWGVNMVDRFIGMFALAIYDKAKMELICLRDRAGVKPLYYYWHNGLFLFASELKSFHKHPGFVKEINLQALHQFMQYGYILAPLSIFNYTNKLFPGHYLKFALLRKEFSIHKYWDIYDSYNKPKLDISKEEAKTHLEQLLISSCTYRMVADVPVGVFLSGGYDSTAITALLQANQSKKIKTYTIGFFEHDYNEAAHAKKVAAHLKTDHTEYYCTSKEAQEIIPDIPYYCDEPFADSSVIPTTLVSRLARKDVTVALSADAGDETFAGYGKYTQSLGYLKTLKRLPSFLKNSSTNILKSLPDSLLIKLTGVVSIPIRKQRLIKLIQQDKISAALIMNNLLSQLYTDEQLEVLFAHKIVRPISFFDSENMLNSSVGELDRMLAIDYKTYMCDDILTKVDRAGMSVSLEGREPLLDQRLTEFAAQIPDHLKINKGIKKYLLKEIVHDYVPREIMDRPKMGFGVPIFNWLRNDLRYYGEEYLNEKAFDEHGLFDKGSVYHIMKQFYQGDNNYNGLFWHLLMFQMWYKRWMS
jgi:asparagine synthase (glutamine-hydrolysing)